MIETRNSSLQCWSQRSFSHLLENNKTSFCQSQSRLLGMGVGGTSGAASLVRTWGRRLGRTKNVFHSLKEKLTKHTGTTTWAKDQTLKVQSKLRKTRLVLRVEEFGCDTRVSSIQCFCCVSFFYGIYTVYDSVLVYCCYSTSAVWI